MSNLDSNDKGSVQEQKTNRYKKKKEKKKQQLNLDKIKQVDVSTEVKSEVSAQNEVAVTDQITDQVVNVKEGQVQTNVKEESDESFLTGGKFVHLIKKSTDAILARMIQDNPVRVEEMNLAYMPISSRVTTYINPKAKKISEIPVYITWDTIDGLRNKVRFNDILKLKSMRFNNAKTLIEDLLNKALEITDMYDCYYIYDKDVKVISSSTGRVMVYNRLLTRSQNNEPNSIISSLTNQAVSLADDIENYYSGGYICKTNKDDNTVTNVVYGLDQVSYDMFARFTRNIGILYDLGPLFKYGYPDINNYQPLYTIASNLNYVYAEREGKLSSPYYENRVYHRLIGQTTRLARLIGNYREVHEYYSTVFNASWVNPYIKSIQAEVVTVNQVTTYLKRTAVGVSATKANMLNEFNTGYLPNSVGIFMDVFIKYINDPFGKLEYKFAGGGGPLELFECLIFMYMFKPQVSDRSYAGAIVKNVLSIIAGATTDANYSYNIANSTYLALIQPDIPIDMYRLLLRWNIYSLGAYPAINDYYALYDNTGSLYGLNDPAGFVYWGRASLNPFAKNMTKRNFVAFVQGLQNIFVSVTNSKLSFYDWIGLIDNIIGVIFTRDGSKLINSLNSFQASMLKITSCPGFINRFDVGIKENVYEIPSKSMYSFTLGIRLNKVNQLYFNFVDWAMMMFYEEIWFTKLAALYIAFERIDLFVSQYARYLNYNQRGIYKDYERLGIIYRYLPECGARIIFEHFESVGDLLSINQLLNTTAVQMKFSDYLKINFGHEFDRQPDKVWCVFYKAVDYLTNLNNWTMHGISPDFQVGPCIINDLSRFSFKMNGPHTRVYDYTAFKHRFGETSFIDQVKRDLRGAIGGNNSVLFRMPTIVEFKEVNDFELFDDNNNFTTSDGGDDIRKWLTKQKPLWTEKDLTIDFAKVVIEYRSNEFNKYNTITPWIDYYVSCDNVRLHLSNNYDDTRDIILPPRHQFNVLEDELIDSTGEVVPGFGFGFGKDTLIRIRSLQI